MRGDLRTVRSACVCVLVALLLGASAPAALAQSEPAFSYAAYCDAQGRFTYDGAAQALVQRPSHLRRVYEDAARGDGRAKEVVRELEEVFHGFGSWVAEQTTRPECLALPELTPGCLPKLGFLDELLGNTPEAARLRDVVAQAYEVRARQRGARNAVILSVVDLLLAHGLTQGVLSKAAAAPRRLPAGAPLTEELGAAKRAPSINWGQQEKHLPGHPNYQPGRSTVTAKPEKLAEKAGTGQQVGSTPVGQPGSKERVDFGEAIGNHVAPSGDTSPTTKGIIHYGKEGVHIVPARPSR